MKCPSCNRNNPPEAKYCYSCGKALPKPWHRKTFPDWIRLIVFIGIPFDSLIALTLLTMPLAPSLFRTAPPGGWGPFSPGVWRLIYLGGGISLVLALFIFFVRGSPPIVGVPLAIVGFMMSTYLIPDFFGKLSDAAAWKGAKLILLLCYILNIFTISSLIKDKLGET